jgi:hypothetical protein
MFRLADLAVEDIQRLVYGFKNSHPTRKLLEPLYAERRVEFLREREEFKRRGKKPSSQDTLATWRARIRGDMDAALQIWERVMGAKATSEERAAIELKVRNKSEWWARGVALALLPPADLDFDETFVDVVFKWLPEAVRRDRAAIQRVIDVWYDRSRIASPLTCAAAVTGAVLNNPDRNYEASEQLDLVHAAFAPLVNLFTADKRTVNALRNLRMTSTVMRSRRLAEVARSLSQ